MGTLPSGSIGALKQLAKISQQQPCQVTQVFLCQRFLWREEWRRRFEKEMDIWFMVHTEAFWPDDLYESLLVGISLPL